VGVFRRCAHLVAARLGHAYPSALDTRLTHYLHEIRALPKPG
jgi:hypothetical protein